MLRFKNKFKFGSSSGHHHDHESNSNKSQKGTPKGTNETASNSSTVDVNKGLQGMSLMDTESTRSENSVQTTQTVSGNNVSGGKQTNGLQQNLDGEDAKASTQEGERRAAGGSVELMTSRPGMLTIKIYNTENVRLPILIANNKQILHTLAANANGENSSNELLKNLKLFAENEQAEGKREPMLSGREAVELLPSSILIPNTEKVVKSLLYLTIEFDNNVLVIEPKKGTVGRSTWNQVVSFDVTKKSNDKNISNMLHLSMFVRLPNILIPEEVKNAQRGFLSTSLRGNTRDSIGDLQIGSIKLPLNLNGHNQAIRLINHQFLGFNNYNIESDGKKMFGEVMLTVDFKPSFKSHLSIDDFDLLKVIGKGSFGKVMQVVKKDTKQIYALKTIRKQHIVARMEVTHTMAERTVLARVTNPFIVPLKFCFQSREKLYFVLSFINGGELFWHLQREGRFSMNRSRFYIAELLTALESLHELNVIYRDLKPENILLDYQGHIALCDFGLCKLNMTNSDRTNTFCGTPEYLAPELLLNQGYTRCVDWWTLGTLLYEMLTGLPPFYDQDRNIMYKRILQNPLRFPPFLENTDAQDLLIKLLQKDPSKRLQEAATIRGHPFFKDIDWNKLLSKTYLPPFKPNVDNLLDTSNFDQDFTSEKPQDSVVDDFLSESVQQQFGGWTYNGDKMLN